MHIGNRGNPVKLAKIIRGALAETKIPFEAALASEPTTMAFDADRQVDEALVFQGKNNGGVYQFSIPKADTLEADGVAVAPAMGVANVINFQPTGEGKAAIAGDFVATAKEVEAVAEMPTTSLIYSLSTSGRMTTRSS